MLISIESRDLRYFYCAFFILLCTTVLVVPRPLPPRIPEDFVDIDVLLEAGDGDQAPALPPRISRQDDPATTSTTTPPPPESTTGFFLSYLFERESNNEPWLQQLLKATAPVLAQEGIGGVIRQSIVFAPVLAVGTANALSKTRIGPLFNLPTYPTTTVIPPHKREKYEDEK